jgi:hypothetical protein
VRDPLKWAPALGICEKFITTITGVRVPRSVHGTAKNNDSESLLRMAIRLGIRSIDTASRKPTGNLAGQEDILANDRLQEPFANGPSARSSADGWATRDRSFRIQYDPMLVSTPLPRYGHPLARIH